jgi:hypothetical protein
MDSGQPNFEGDHPDERASQRRLRRIRRRVAEAVSENQALLPLAGVVLGVLLALGLGRTGGTRTPTGGASPWPRRGAV